MTYPLSPLPLLKIAGDPWENSVDNAAGEGSPPVPLPESTGVCEDFGMKKPVWFALVAAVGMLVGAFFFRYAPLNNAKPSASADSANTETADNPEEGGAEVLEDSHKTIARVGDFEFVFSRNITDVGGARPEVFNTYEAKHSATKQPLKATDVFAEAALVAGFARAVQADIYSTDPETKDSFQRLVSSNSASDLARNLAALQATTSLGSLEDCEGEEFSFDPHTENFAVIGFNEMTGTATVHLGVTGTSHLCNAGFPRLKIEVETPERLKKAFSEALSGKNGFFPKLAELKACETCEPIDTEKIELSGP